MKGTIKLHKNLTWKHQKLKIDEEYREVLEVLEEGDFERVGEELLDLMRSCKTFIDNFLPEPYKYYEKKHMEKMQKRKWRPRNART